MNKSKLMDAMRQAKITKSEICRQVGMSRSAFYRKCNGISEFTLAEISSIMNVLHLKSADDIFFDKKVS